MSNSSEPLAYQNLAMLYDEFSDPDGESRRLERVCRHLEAGIPTKHAGNRRPRLADLGCGTGLYSWPLAALSYDVTALDLSPAMLKQAKAKAQIHGTDTSAHIRFIEADLLSFKAEEPFDAILLLTDTLNHIDPADLHGLGSQLANQLRPGGLLIFDLLKREFLRTERGNACFYSESHDGICMVWNNHWDEAEGIAFSDFVFFRPDSDGRYRREQDSVTEYAHDAAKLLQSWSDCFYLLDRHDVEEREEFVLRRR